MNPLQAAMSHPVPPSVPLPLSVNERHLQVVVILTQMQTHLHFVLQAFMTDQYDASQLQILSLGTNNPHDQLVRAIDALREVLSRFTLQALQLLFQLMSVSERGAISKALLVLQRVFSSWSLGILGTLYQTYRANYQDFAALVFEVYLIDDPVVQQVMCTLLQSSSETISTYAIPLSGLTPPQIDLLATLMSYPDQFEEMISYLHPVILPTIPIGLRMVVPVIAPPPNLKMRFADDKDTFRSIVNYNITPPPCIVIDGYHSTLPGFSFVRVSASDPQDPLKQVGLTGYLDYAAGCKISYTKLKAVKSTRCTGEQIQLHFTLYYYADRISRENVYALPVSELQTLDTITSQPFEVVSHIKQLKAPKAVVTYLYPDCVEQDVKTNFVLRGRNFDRSIRNRVVLEHVVREGTGFSRRRPDIIRLVSIVTSCDGGTQVRFVLSLKHAGTYKVRLWDAGQLTRTFVTLRVTKPKKKHLGH